MLKISCRNFKILSVFPAFCCLGILFFAGCGKNSSLPTQTLLNEALKDASSGRRDKALSNLEIVTRREPNNVAALIFKAVVYEGSGKDDLAVNTARLAVRAAPKNFQAQYTLGRLYSKDQSKMQDAIPPLVRALELRPHDTNTLILLARCSSIFKLDSAIKYYTELAADKKFRKCAELWNEMGIYYAGRQQVQKAAQCFVKAYKLDSSKPQIVLNYATFADYYAGESKRAVGFYKKYLAITVPSPNFAAQRKRVEARIKEIEGNG
jgi:tetratricopeptide (TPR) repeat protein